MNPAENIIHSAVFNFEYENKAAASKSNNLIESIFYSRILPELETAISNKIPDGVRIELSKLEINIGNIAERDLAEKLAGQMRSSLEKALDLNLNIATDNTDDIQNSHGESSSWSILAFIEIFLTKGYFPYAIDRPLSIDDLVVEAIQKYKQEFTGILKKHRTHDIVIRRTAFNLKTKTFDKIIWALKPVNTEWIFAFRKQLVQLRKELNLNHYNNNEFIHLLHYSILKYLLNNSAPGFSKKNFATFILNEFADMFRTSTQQVLQPDQKLAGQDSMVALIRETLKEIQVTTTRTRDKEIPLAQFIQMLNSGKIGISKRQRETLKTELIRAIQNEEKRKRFIEKLNETGALFVLDLMDKEKAPELFTLITSFTKEVITQLDKTVAMNKLAVQSALYLSEKTIREFSKEEFILFIIHSAGLDEAETFKSLAFRQFIKTLKDIDQKKLSSVLKAEQEFHEISEINELLLKTGKAAQQPASVNREYLHIYQKKIVGYFLDSGHLPAAFSTLSRTDVQQIFYGLLEQKDPLLAERIKKNENASDFADRLNLLTDNRSSTILHEYLTQFFSEEFSILSKIVGEIAQHFTFRTGRIHTNTFMDELFISALAKSKGGSLSVFTFFALEQLNVELIKETTEPEKLFRFIETKSLETLQISPSGKDVPTEENNLLYTLLHQIKAAPGKLETEHLKDFLTLVGSDRETRAKFVSEALKTGNFPHLPFENKKIQNYIELLLGFSKIADSRLTKGFWQTMLMQFALQIFPNEKQLTPENFIHQFANHLYKALAANGKEDMLPDITNDLRVSGSKELKEIGDFWPTSTKKSSPELFYTDEIDFYAAALDFYAENEFMPWWAPHVSLSTILERESILKQRMDKFPVAAWKKLKSTQERNIDSGKDFKLNAFIKTAGKDNKVLLRGLYKWNDEQILSQWLANSPEIAGQIREYLFIAPYFYFRNVTPPLWRQAVYRFALKYYGEQQKVKDDPFHSHFLDDLKKRYDNINWPGILSTVYQTARTEHKNFPAALVQLLNLESSLRPATNDKENQDVKKRTMDETGIETYINNAGLILFWPFLTRLFEQLSLLKEGAFVNNESRNRAVYILQYLVYNEINFPEYELVLNKLLVGMPPDVHLEPFIELTDNEKDMTKSLLNGLISNWDKVKNSTPEGIQETFLQREGVLTFKAEVDSLTIEKKGVDVLMHSIPWNFSVIKLAWMKKPLQVKWI